MPRLVAGGVDTASSDKEQAATLNVKGAPPAQSITAGSLKERKGTHYRVYLGMCVGDAVVFFVTAAVGQGDLIYFWRIYFGFSPI